MRLISIADDKGRDAMVGIASCSRKKKAGFVSDPEHDFDTILAALTVASTEKKVRYIKSSVESDGNTIIHENGGDMNKAAQAIIQDDPDIDLLREGMEVPKMHRVYLTNDNEAACDIHFEERIYDAAGAIKEVRPYAKTECNIQNENFPIRWTGITVPYKTAFTRYVFTHHYQLFHTNGLTYDFLYSMAKALSDQNVMMFVGGGKDGSDPVVLRQGGKKYRAFMSGTVRGEDYALLLHFTQFDLENYIK